MSNLLSIWSGLDLRKRIVVILATAGVFAALLAIGGASGRGAPVLLYAGLDSRNAGAVIAALDAANTVYEVRGDAIYVDPAQRDQMRMALAAQGLPASGGAGYELLDQLSGFGTTSQMFDAAYWRAKEGELARTILANPAIRSARVHIARAPARPFQADAGSKASVTLTTATGQVPIKTARTIRHLVAASVAGMAVHDVAVIDSVGGLVADPGLEGNGTMVSDRETELQERATRLLEARVGPGRAIVQVSAEMVTERESISERLVDPKSRVAISSETEERASSETGSGGGVTVASNLPEGETGGGSGDSSSTSETRERTNFEVSETTREVLRAPGAIKRLSVAVLIDGQPVTATDGTITNEPRPESELAILRELVASAVGLDESRGDTLAIRSLTFEAIDTQGTTAEASAWAFLSAVDLFQLISLAVLALVALVLGLFVLRPTLRAQPAPALTAGPEALGLIAGDANGATTAAVALARPADRVADGEILTEEDEPVTATDPMERLRALIAERQTESVQILQGWLESAEEAK